jgi:hypothetical protein
MVPLTTLRDTRHNGKGVLVKRHHRLHLATVTTTSLL